MRRYALFHLMFALYLMYFALPEARQYDSFLEGVFWASWFIFFFFIIGANLARLLRISSATQLPADQGKKSVQRQN
ncbi:MAG: hypothetical protein H0Z32_08445 [Bacillaceae bacterium]|nr:hypothetical protein [Bacillaceae bacterium]